MPPIQQNPQSQIDEEIQKVINGLLEKVKERLPEGVLTREQIDEYVKVAMAEDGIERKYGTRSIAFKNSVREDLYLAQIDSSSIRPNDQETVLDVAEVAPVVELSRPEPAQEERLNTSTQTEPSTPIKKSTLIEWEEERDARAEENARLASIRSTQGELPI